MRKCGNAEMTEFKHDLSTTYQAFDLPVLCSNVDDCDMLLCQGLRDRSQRLFTAGTKAL